jgi:hypothetical protein
MLSTPEISKGPELKPAPFDRDEKVVEKILTPEYLNQPGAKIAIKFLDSLGIPHGQWSSYKYEDQVKEKNLAENLTNKAGALYNSGSIDNFIKEDEVLSRDPRIFLKNLDPKLLDAMDPKLSAIFKNEFDHNEAKKNSRNPDKETMPFAYVRLPGGIDLVMKGYWHSASWQKEHGEYLARTAKNAQAICIEGGIDTKIGDSLKLSWENNLGDYDELMRESVKQGFHGFFADTGMGDMLKIKLDTTGGKDWRFPDLPDEFFQKYLGYLNNFFPEDALQIATAQNLKEILKRLSTTNEGAINSGKDTPINNIYTHSPAYLDKNLKTQWEMTGLELGLNNCRDAMSALKLHLIANEMREGRMEKGIIVDFEGAGHFESIYSFLKNPLYALMTVLKNPQFVLMEQLTKKDDVPNTNPNRASSPSLNNKIDFFRSLMQDPKKHPKESSNPLTQLTKEGDVKNIYPAFSPNQKMFEDMFGQIFRLELARPEKIPGKTGIEPGSQQMPMKKYDIPGRKEILGKKLENLNLPVFSDGKYPFISFLKK